MTIEKQLDEIIESIRNNPKTTNTIKNKKLFDYLKDEKIIQDDIFRNKVETENKYQLTVKGEVFNGFQKEKEISQSKLRTDKLRTDIVFAGAILAGIYSCIKIFQLICHLLCH